LKSKDFNWIYSVFQLIIPLEKLTISKKSKSQDCYEQLAENIRSLTMNNGDAERKVNIYFLENFKYWISL
jgi:hypothetical protein